MWEQMINNMHYSYRTPPSRKIVIPNPDDFNVASSNNSTAEGGTAGSFSSKNWSGYVNYSSEQSYDEATSYFVEPSPSVPCSKATEVTWAGLGGYNSHNLAQNGTGYNAPGLENHQGWWEILPAGYVSVPENGSPGYYFEAQTYYAGVISGKKTFYFYFYDYEEGSWWDEEVTTTNGVDESTADYIVERPKASGYFRPLADYGSTKMQGFTNNKDLAHYPYNVGTMYSGETELASVAGIPPSSYLFTDTWHHCGKEEE